MFYHQKKSEAGSGQTLVEVMVALFVLTVGLLGILTLLSQSIFISKNITAETTATYLAAEGIELSQNIIEHDVYQHLAGLGTGWGSAFNLGSGGEFELDYTTCNDKSQGESCVVPLSGFSCSSDLLYYDPVSHVYLYPGDDGTASPVPTIFSRCIRVTPTTPYEFTVQSIVYWPAVGGTQNVELEDVFYNWQSSS